MVYVFQANEECSEKKRIKIVKRHLDMVKQNLDSLKDALLDSGCQQKTSARNGNSIFIKFTRLH